MLDYKVEYIGKNSNRNYKMFDSMKKAETFAKRCKGIIKEYNSDTFEYNKVADYTM